MSKDLRTYLNHLHKSQPKEIKMVDQEIDRKWEVTALVEKLKKDTNFEIVDISKTSVKITKSIVDFLVKKEKKINYTIRNIFDFKSPNKFDFITIGEVLEHVTKPQKILKQLNNLISDNGSIYMSTCVDCPSIDHVYHFKSVKEIEQMINNCGFKIALTEVITAKNSIANKSILSLAKLYCVV